MRCKYCDGQSKVIDVLKLKRLIRRRRECVKCGERWNTVEEPAGVERRKAVDKAVEKRPVAPRPQQITDLNEDYFDDDLDNILEDLGL